MDINGVAISHLYIKLSQYVDQYGQNKVMVLKNRTRKSRAKPVNMKVWKIGG